MHACMHTYIHTYIQTNKQTYIHTYIHTYIPTYIHTYIHTCVYTRTHTHTHTHRLTVIKSVTYSFYCTFIRPFTKGAPVGAVCWNSALHPGRTRVQLPIWLFGCLLTKSLRPHYDPAIVSFSNRNDYLGYLLFGKDGWRIELTILPTLLDTDHTGN